MAFNVMGPDDIMVDNVYQDRDGDPWGITKPLAKVLEVTRPNHKWQGEAWVRYITGTYHHASDNHMKVEYDPVFKAMKLDTFKRIYRICHGSGLPK